MAKKHENLDGLIFLAMPAIKKYHNGGLLEKEEQAICARLYDTLTRRLDNNTLSDGQLRILELVLDVIEVPAVIRSMNENEFGSVHQTDRMRLS